MNEFRAPGVEPMQDFTGKQIQEAGRAQMGFGNALTKIGDRIQGEVDDTRTAERVNNLATTLDSINTEYSQLQGANAFNAKSDYQARVAKAVQEVGGGFENDIQKTLYMAKAGVLQRTTIGAIERHGATEYTKYDTTEKKSTVINMTGAMAQSWRSRGQLDPQGNPTGDYAMYEAAAVRNLVGYANKIGIPQLDDKGQETQVFQALKREMVFEPAATSVTRSMMVDGNYTGAKRFLEEEFQKGRLDPQAYQALNDNVTTAAKTVDAERIARDLVAGKTIQGGVTFQPPLLAMPEVSSKFGKRAAPMPGASTDHNGIDLPAPRGTPVYATADGVVKNAWDDQKSGGGNSVVLTHAGNMATGYAHMERFTVKPGQQVKQGDLIGYVGSTGTATGPHLHFTVTGANGKKIDPAQLQYGVAMGNGKIEEGPQTLQQKQAAIDAIQDPQTRKFVQAEFNRITSQQEALKSKQERDNFEQAANIAFGGDGNQWQTLAKNNPALWNALKPEQQATLMNGRPKGDDPETMLLLLRDPTKWEASQLSQYRGKISENTYQRFYAQGNGPKAQDTVRAASFDNDMFESTMLRNNLPDLVDPKNPEKKKEVINLREKFKVLIDAEQVARKRELSRDEKQSILDSILLDKAQVPGMLWGSTPTPVYKLTPEQAKDAFVIVGGQEVKLASIPVQQRATIIAKLNARGIRPTEAEIASLWVQAGKPK
jgi:murein DD-endopeptidase MepM/ murein hydrolase activator NlpD